MGELYGGGSGRVFGTMDGMLNNLWAIIRYQKGRGDGRIIGISAEPVSTFSRSIAGSLLLFPVPSPDRGVHVID